MDLPGNVAIGASPPVPATQPPATSSTFQPTTVPPTQNIHGNNENVVAVANGGNASTPLDECLVCSDLKRDTVFKVKYLITIFL